MKSYAIIDKAPIVRLPNEAGMSDANFPIASTTDKFAISGNWLNKKDTTIPTENSINDFNPFTNDLLN